MNRSDLPEFKKKYGEKAFFVACEIHEKENIISFHNDKINQAKYHIKQNEGKIDALHVKLVTLMNPPKCDFEKGNSSMACHNQVKKFKSGYVLAYKMKNEEMIWIKKSDLKPKQEIVSSGVDWIHCHCSKKCSEVYKAEYPKEYAKDCEYFGVAQ